MPCSGTTFPEPWDTEPDGARHLQSWSTSSDGGGWLTRVKSWNFAPDFANASKVLKNWRTPSRCRWMPVRSPRMPTA